MFQQIKNLLEFIAKHPIQMPTGQVIGIASDMDTTDVTSDVNSYINDFAVEYDWLYDNIIGTDINYILFICIGLFALICMECIFVGSNLHSNHSNDVDFLENENMVYYYDNRPIGRYRYLCNAETMNGRRCRRRIKQGTTCNLH